MAEIWIRIFLGSEVDPETIKAVLNPERIAVYVDILPLDVTEEPINHHGCSVALFAKVGIPSIPRDLDFELLTVDYTSNELWNQPKIQFELDCGHLVLPESFDLSDSDSRDESLVSLSYFLRVTVFTNDGGSPSAEMDIKVVVVRDLPEDNAGLILSSLGNYHSVKAEFYKSKFQIGDFIEGKLQYNFSDNSAFMNVKSVVVKLIRTLTAKEVFFDHDGTRLFGMDEIVVNETTIDSYQAPFNIIDLDPGVTYDGPMIRFWLKNRSPPSKELTPTLDNFGEFLGIKYYIRLFAHSDDGVEDVILDQKEVILYRFLLKTPDALMLFGSFNDDVGDINLYPGV